jgi:hypothetical protein
MADHPDPAMIIIIHFTDADKDKKNSVSSEDVDWAFSDILDTEANRDEDEEPPPSGPAPPKQREQKKIMIRPKSAPTNRTNNNRNQIFEPRDRDSSKFPKSRMYLAENKIQPKLI